MAFSKNADVFLQIRRIKKSLDGVVKNIEDEVKATLAVQAALVAQEIKSLAPVDSDSQSPGALKDSVRVEDLGPGKRSPFRFAIMAGNEKTRKPVKAGKGFYDYARSVEFGSQERPAYPFFYAVWRARRKEVRAAVRKAVKNAVGKTFK